MRVTSANPTQILRAPVQRGARNNGCYINVLLDPLYQGVGLETESPVHGWGIAVAQELAETNTTKIRPGNEQSANRVR
jgi:hypothetical protein